MIKPLIQYLLNLFYPLFRQLLTYEIYAYLAVGAANTILNIFLFVLCYQLILPKDDIAIWGLHIASYTISLMVAFLATVPTGFWLTKHFAFNQNGHNHDNDARQLGKYFLVVFQGLFTDYLLLISLIIIVGFQPTIAKLISTGLVISLNYLLQKYFTFKVKPA